MLGYQSPVLLATDLTGPLVSGLLAGWGVAIPLGAIGVMLVDLGVRAGMPAAGAAAAGVATADLLYALVAAAAGSAVTGVLDPHERALRLAAAATLAVIAVLSLRRSPAAAAAAPPAGGRLYVRFLALTSINPTTVIYFAALIAGLPAVADAPASAKAAFVAAVGLASLSWQLVLAGAGATLGRRLPAAARLWTSVAGTALILGFALHMALAA